MSGQFSGHGPELTRPPTLFREGHRRHKNGQAVITRKGVSVQRQPHARDQTLHQAHVPPLLRRYVEPIVKDEKVDEKVTDTYDQVHMVDLRS